MNHQAGGRSVTEARGERIAGSRFVRDFCASCGCPIRVVVADGDQVCLDCDPDHHAGGGHYGPVYMDDPSPWDENNVRHLEDCR